MKNSRFQNGMTLIEILVALGAGAFLLAGVLKIFVDSKRTYSVQENLSRLQEDGRFAMEFLSRDIRMAGYWGCVSPTDLDRDVFGTDNNAVNGDGIDNGTDTIRLRGAFTQATTGPCGSRDLMSPADSTNIADLPNQANLNQPVPPATFPPPATFYTDPSSTITYRINNGILEKITNGVTYPLVEGIENMQVLYGVDTDPAGAAGFGAPNFYVTANNVLAANWPRVVSIRISLLGVTRENNLADQPLPYTYNGVRTTEATNPAVTDRRIRRVFDTTIAVRNRL